MLAANNNLYTQIDCLPHNIPVYIKLPCGSLKSHCHFEMQLNTVESVNILMSCIHPFPTLEDDQFERQKGYVQELQKKQKDGKGKPAQQEQQEKKISFYFSKLNQPPHMNIFADDDNIYMTFLSEKGGILKIKADFNNNQGQ